MKPFICFFLFLIIAISGQINAEVRLVHEFYDRIEHAASVLKIQADVEAKRSHLHAQQSLKGWEVFASVSGGYQKSPFAREPFGQFFDPMTRIGVRYPLLGSSERQQRAIEDAATQLKIEGIRLDWSRHLATQFIEENYAAYWSAQKTLLLTDAFLRLYEEGIAQLLQKRQAAGLLLKSDHFEFSSAFEHAQRIQIEFSHHKIQALMRLGHLTDTAVLPFEAVKSPLREISAMTPIDLDQPDLRILRAQIDNLSHLRDTQKWQGIESDVAITGFGGPAIPTPMPPGESMQWGYGGAISVNVRVPLEIVSYRKHEQSRLNSELVSLRTDYTRRDQELQHEFQLLLGSYRQMIQQLQFQQSRLNAAQESMRERYLRLKIMDGDVIEKYLQALNTYYRTVIEFVGAEAELWKLHIRLRQFISFSDNNKLDDHPETAPASMLIEPILQSNQFLLQKQTISNTDDKPIPLSLSFQAAAYVWDSHQLIGQPVWWKKKVATRTDRLLLSLNAQQIAKYVKSPSRLKQFLHDARQRGKKVELLLGDPDWILPDQRKKLLVIIKQLRQFNFDALHLDIEPDQLESKMPAKDRLTELIETVRQAKAISNWPIGISIHPRYLIEETSFGLCLPCAMEDIGIKEIAIMYYSMNIPGIVSTLQAAMQRYPALKFSLAQSLERELGSENSYMHKPYNTFVSAMQQLLNQLHGINFGGLIIQSWQDWEAYLHENSI